MPTRLATAANIAGVPLTLIYITSNVHTAEKVEQILKDARIDFVADLEPYTNGSFLLGNWQYMGLFFYVPTSRFNFCRDLLHSSGMTDTIELEVPPHGA